MGKVCFQASEVDTQTILASVRNGDKVVLNDGNQEVASVTACPPKHKGVREPGSLKGKIHLDESFWDPLPEDELRLWEGHGD